MQKILRKRIGRDLKENLLRYLALAAMIILCMYIVISLIGTADTMILGSDRFAQRAQLEDGQFQVFVPLKDAEIKRLEEKGIVLEEQFYLDYEMQDESTLRVFKNREHINLLEPVEGREAEAKQELVIERRYAEEHDLTVGDTICIGDNSFEIVGIGCTPDYDAVYKNLTDSSVDSKQFGTVFMTEEAYESLRAEGKSIKAEEYVYAYLLQDAMRDEELKELLEEQKVEADAISDVYFQEYWKEQTKEKQEMEDGIQDLRDGANELEDGLADLTEVKTGFAALDEGIVQAADGAEELAEGIQELQDETTRFLEEHLEIEISNLRSFLKVADNPRAKAAANDQVINKLGGIIAGGIILALFAYVISVFVVYGIEKENTTIGALYALGVKRTELMTHYLCLPVVITGIAGAIGCVIGFAAIGESTIVGNCYSYFSIPNMPPVYPPYLIAYGVVLPPVLTAIVNWLVIRKKLNKPALQLLKNEQKLSSSSQIKLGKMGFVTTFRIRQMLRETRTSLTMIGGMFIALLILMLGLDCYAMCNNISIDNKKDTKYEYLYTYKYPTKEVPEGGYEAFSKGMKKEHLGYNLDVTILGLTKDQPFFDVTLTDSKSEVVISSAMAEKYALEKGDIFVLEDEEVNMHYAFSVKDVAPYSVSYYVFMDIDCMREMFGESKDYYNQVFASEELEVENGRLYALTTKKDIDMAADVFIQQMEPMIQMMIVVSSLVFAVVMYLMVKIMLDRSAFHISMVKVFGYHPKEIKKLYLNGNFYIIVAGACICIPLSKWCMDRIYPYMVANVACGMKIEFEIWMYALVFAGVIVVYLLTQALLVRKLHKVNLAEVLKNRE